MALDLTWLGCDLVTGRIIEELPDLTPAGAISSVLATATSAQFALPLALDGPGAPPKQWQSATGEGRTMIVAVLGGTPIWAGIPLVVKAGTGPVADIACVSLEGYLDRRYTGDHTWTQQDEASVIAAGLVADANIEGINFLVDAPATGTLRDRTYYDRDDKTVYSGLRELMGITGGPEWTIALGWTDSTQTVVSTTVRIRPRIGVAAAVPSAVFDAQAAAVFDATGVASATYEQVRDYTAGRGANHVLAVSSGQGDSRPQSAPARDETLLTNGWPRWEHRFTPSTSITNTATLDAHATRALQLLRLGAVTVSLTARADTYPMLGRDWTLGDDIGYDLTGHGHPTGLAGVARCIGWQLDARRSLITPLLLHPGEETL